MISRSFGCMVGDDKIWSGPGFGGVGRGGGGGRMTRAHRGAKYKTLLYSKSWKVSGTKKEERSTTRMQNVE